MSFCPSCGVEVREGKAFCYNCGASMSQPAAGQGERPSPDLFEATVVVPPPQDARPTPLQPPPSAAPPELRRPAPGVPEGVGAAGGGRRKFSYGKFGLGVVALLLLVLLGLFALAVLVD
ncbi:MAG: zinc-ribbon domain-containing protein [Acidobacteria bacterium]|nr:zinc-ribbon domain-containing protein [Acidobacteriota bacterium]